MSEKQLHEPTTVAEVTGAGFAVRSCEMEACSEPQHRSKVNLQAGLPVWASGLPSVTPDIRSWSGGEAGAAGHHCVLPREISNDPGNASKDQLTW